jgi:glycosyltransferase involved in cell wall biosynthesis
MIRLFVDGHVFDQEYQGSRSFIHGLYSHLAGYQDIEIIIAAHDVERLRDQFGRDSGITFIGYRSTNRLVRYGWDIPRILRHCRIDLAHFQYMLPVYCPCRSIVTIHDVLFNDFPTEFPQWYRLIRNATFRPAARLADILTTDSAYSRQAISRHYHIPVERISVVPVGVDDQFLQPYDRNAAAGLIREKYGVADYILCVSRIEPRKNQALLLKSYLTLRLWERGLAIVFVGKRSLPYNQFTRLLKSVPQAATGYIHWIEQVPPDDLLRFNQAARLSVYPSKCEGFGLPPLEAAALGKMSLCSNTTAMSEYTFLGEYLFDPADEQAFEDLLGRSCRKALTDSGMIESYPQIVKKRYSWETIAARFHDLILEAVG